MQEILTDKQAAAIVALGLSKSNVAAMPHCRRPESVIRVDVHNAIEFEGGLAEISSLRRLEIEALYNAECAMLRLSWGHIVIEVDTDDGGDESLSADIFVDAVLNEGAPANRVADELVLALEDRVGEPAKLEVVVGDGISLCASADITFFPRAGKTAIDRELIAAFLSEIIARGVIPDAVEQALAAVRTDA